MFAARPAAVGLWTLALAALVSGAAVAQAPPGAVPAPPAAAEEPAAVPAVPPPVPVVGPAIGISDRLYLRTSGDEIVLFPTARLQVDGAFFPRQNPKSGVFIRRARVGLSGWLGGVVYFDLSVEVAPTPPDGTQAVAPSALSPTDDYLAFAPWGDRMIIQAGQFDAPFTLENRTSDAFTDFIERSMAVRILGVPQNKEVGAMVHGLLADGRVYYSGGAFNGEGPGFRNLDNQPALIGRAFVAPYGLGHLSVGGSAWYSRHVLGPAIPVQATPGGLPFLVPSWTTSEQSRLLALHENGQNTAFAAELNLPLGTRFGLRAEGVYRRQRLVEADVSLLPAGPIEPAGNALLEGIAGYGEAWFWLIGNSFILPAPGLELPARTGRPQVRVFEEGLMLALRGEFLKEDLTSDQPTLGDPNRATTRVVAGTLGLNYWQGRFVRLSMNYVVNYWSGTSETIKAVAAQGTLEHELLLRFAMSL